MSVYKTITNGGVVLKLRVLNKGTAKATDIRISIVFPKDIFVYDIDDIEKMRAYARNVLGLGEDSYILCESEPFEVSSTQIRDMVRAGEDIGALVPKAVLDIIEKEGLYRD